MDFGGTKSKNFSQNMMQAANRMAEMAAQAQKAAKAGDSVDPLQQIAGMVQIAGAAVLSIKQQAEIKAVYYAAMAAVAFGNMDWWAGAEYVLAAGLFAEAAGTAGKSVSAGGGRSGGSGGSGGGYGGRESPSLAPSGTASASTALVSTGAGGGGGRVTIMVVGENEAGRWVAGVLNKHVENYGGRLVASHAQHQPGITQGAR
jgi:hypothetical protein